MVVKEIVIINGEEFCHTFSDAGKVISYDGVKYTDAIDAVGNGLAYTELDEVAPVTLTASMMSSPIWSDEGKEIYEVRVDGCGNLITQLIYG